MAKQYKYFLSWVGKRSGTGEMTYGSASIVKSSPISDHNFIIEVETDIKAREGLEGCVILHFIKFEDPLLNEPILETTKRFSNL